MSMTMVDRERTERESKVVQLKRDLDLLQLRIKTRIEEGDHLAGNSIDF